MDSGEVNFSRGIGRVELDRDGDGVPELTITTLTDGEATGWFTFTSPGVRSIVARVFDPGGALVYTATRKVNVLPFETMSERVTSPYVAMIEGLRQGDVTHALSSVSGDAYEKYQAVFTALGSSVSVVADQLGTMTLRGFGSEIGELAVVRDTPSGPTAFLIQLIKGPDGVWRIEGM